MEGGGRDTSADLGGLRISEEKRGRGSGAARWLIAAAVGLIVIVVAAWLASRRPPVVDVAAARAEAGGPAALLNASGYVTPRRRATVAAKITARVVEMRADEGMVVAAGDLLARLDDVDARKRLAAARAERAVAAAAVHDIEVNLANAGRELARAASLEREGVASTQALDLARTSEESLRARLAVARGQVLAADAVVAQAEQDVDNYIVRAPFAGIVVSKDAQPGEMVSPISAGSGFTRTGIATIVDMGSLEIEVDVNESYIARVRAEQPVEATLDAYPDWQIPARVRTVIPTADRQKATVKVRVAFDRLDPRILPDMGVKVAFLGDGPGAAAAPRVRVPAAAVRRESGGSAVWVVREGRAERRAVRTGDSRGGEVTLLAGVADGEQVIVGGGERLRDGQTVTVR